jgi:hypothetical protein
MVAIEGLWVHSDATLGGLVHQIEVDLLVPRGVRQLAARLDLRSVARFERLDHLISVTYQVLALAQLVILYVEVFLFTVRIKVICFIKASVLFLPTELRRDHRHFILFANTGSQ